MFGWHLSRFHGLTILALAAGVFATPGWPQAVTVAGYIVLVVLGVSFPRLQMFGPILCRVDVDRKVVALTFDDGPDPEVTPALLDLLGREGIAAAFFCIGHKVARHPEIVRRIAADGHLLGNHSHGHSRRTNLFGVRRLDEDLGRAQDELQRLTGLRPLLFRPPMGLTNPRVFRVIRRRGLQAVGWTARGMDTVARDPETVVRRILRGAGPGAILLLHDGGVSARVLLPAVRTLIAELRSRGFEFQRLDRMMAMAPSRHAGRPELENVHAS